MVSPGMISDELDLDFSLAIRHIHHGRSQFGQSRCRGVSLLQSPFASLVVLRVLCGQKLHSEDRKEKSAKIAKHL